MVRYILILEYLRKSEYNRRNIFLWRGREDMAMIQCPECMENRSLKKLVRLMMCCVIAGIILTGCGKCEHEYNDGVITKEATCTEEGEKTFTCSLCGETAIESVPVIEHEYLKEEITKQSTCAEEGEKTLTCENCGATKTESIPKKTHSYKEEITKEPTVDEEGMKTFTCEWCGDTYTEAIPIIKDKVIVTVREKRSLDINYDEYRFSPRVDFSFEVYNNTDKDIKGVQGELHIKDLFGVEFINGYMDFVGQTIKAKESEIYEYLGYDLNRLAEEDMKLFNTDYDDLIFEYKVTSIVYEDDENQDEDDVSEEKDNTHEEKQKESESVKSESVSMTAEEAMQWLNGSWDAGDGVTYNFNLNADGTLPIPSVGQFWSGYSSGTWSCNGDMIVMTGFREETPNMGFGYVNAKYKVTKIDENTASIEGISYVEGHEEIGSNSTTKTMKRI